jgi:hypothetical protein
MAEPTPSPVAPGPALTSTADTTPYVSVSWMAVAAAVAAGLFVFLLLLFGYAAFRERKPLIITELLILPVVAIVFCFAARKMIHNSEGTRTGVLFGFDLVKNSWWVALVGGLGYVAYLFAIDYSIQRDAAAEAERWVGFVLKGDEVSLNQAFIRLEAPGRRANLNPNNTANLVDQFRDKYVAFGQCDLVQLGRRNPDACQFVPGGVRDWVYQPGAIRCVLAGTVKCPEGTFPVSIELQGVEPSANSEMVGRQWQVQFQVDRGYVAQNQAARTPYGWRVAELERRGGEFGRSILEACAQGKGTRAALYHSQFKPDARPEVLDTQAALLSRFRGLVGFDPTVFLLFTPDYPEYIRDKFLRTEKGGEPPSKTKDLFLRVWLENGLMRPGSRIQKNDTIDGKDVLTVTDSAVEVRVPCEVPISGTMAAARARLVVACTEPDVLAELKRLRSEANPDQTVPPPQDIGTRVFKWRVVRLESDMYEVKQSGPGGLPGGPPGPPEGAP